MADKVLKTYINYIYDNLKTDDMTYNLNLSKKLKYLAVELTESIFMKNNYIGEKMIIDSYTELLKKGANYLRLDSIQVIKEILEDSHLEKLSLEEILGILD